MDNLGASEGDDGSSRSSTSGETVTIWMKRSDLDLIDSAAGVFKVSRSAVIRSLIEENREALEGAIAEKTKDLLGRT